MKLYQQLKDSEIQAHKLQQEKELWKVNEQKLLSELELTHLKDVEMKLQQAHKKHLKELDRAVQRAKNECQ